MRARACLRLIVPFLLILEFSHFPTGTLRASQPMKIMAFVFYQPRVRGRGLQRRRCGSVMKLTLDVQLGSGGSGTLGSGSLEPLGPPAPRQYARRGVQRRGRAQFLGPLSGPGSSPGKPKPECKTSKKLLSNFLWIFNC